MHSPWPPGLTAWEDTDQETSGMRSEEVGVEKRLCGQLGPSLPLQNQPRNIL